MVLFKGDVKCTATPNTLHNRPQPAAPLDKGVLQSQKTNCRRYLWSLDWLPIDGGWHLLRSSRCKRKYMGQGLYHPCALDQRRRWVGGGGGQAGTMPGNALWQTNLVGVAGSEDIMSPSAQRWQGTIG